MGRVRIVLALALGLAVALAICGARPGHKADIQAEIRRYLSIMDDTSATEAVREDAAIHLAEFGEAALPGLILDLMKHDLDTQRLASYALISLNTPRASSAIRDVLIHETDVEQQRFLISVLSRRRDIVAARAMARIVLRHPDPLMRAQVLSKLSDLNCDMSPYRFRLIRDLTRQMPLRIVFYGIPVRSSDLNYNVRFTVTNVTDRRLRIEWDRFFIYPSHPATVDEPVSFSNIDSAGRLSFNFPAVDPDLRPRQTVEGSFLISSLFPSHTYANFSLFSIALPRYQKLLDDSCEQPNKNYGTVSLGNSFPGRFLVIYAGRPKTASNPQSTLFSASDPVYFHIGMRK